MTDRRDKRHVRASGRSERISSPVNITEFRSMMREAGIEDTANRILVVFLEDAPGRLADLEAAAERGNGPDVRMAAHAFKSAAATIRAEALTALLHRMEQAAEAGDLTAVAGMVTGVRAEVEHVLAFLGPLRSE